MARELKIEEIEIEREVLNIHPHRWIRFYGWQRLKVSYPHQNISINKK